MFDAVYLSDTQFIVGGNRSTVFKKNQRVTCYMGPAGNKGVTVVVSSYDPGTLITTVTIKRNTLANSLYRVAPSNSFYDDETETGCLAEHPHLTPAGGGYIPAATMSDPQVTTLKSVDIPQDGDEHKFLKVAPAYGDGYQLASLVGTANRLAVTPGDGQIILTTPQDSHTGASPTFAGLTLSALTGIMEAKGASAVGIVAATGSLQIFRRNADNSAYEFALVNLNELGDTNLTNVAAGDILFRNASNRWVNLAKGSDGDLLTLSSGLPAWITLALKHLSDVADAVTDSGVAGDILVRGASVYDRLPKGEDGKALIIDTATHLPAYGLPSMTFGNLSDVSDTCSPGATGDTYFRDSDGDVKKLAVGTGDQVLGISSGKPGWRDSPDGDVFTLMMLCA